jgi:hypothetical protein
MGKPAVSRDDFRGLIAFYAAKARHDQNSRHDHKPQGERSLLKMFGSADDILETVLQQWSDRVELLGCETIGRSMDPRVRHVTHRNGQYDHASDFLHTLLRDLEQKMH